MLIWGSVVQNLAEMLEVVMLAGNYSQEHSMAERGVQYKATARTKLFIYNLAALEQGPYIIPFDPLIRSFDHGPVGYSLGNFNFGVGHCKASSVVASTAALAGARRILRLMIQILHDLI